MKGVQIKPCKRALLNCQVAPTRSAYPGIDLMIYRIIMANAGKGK